LNEAAEILVKIGRASKNQADQTVFYDAERWKQEGQLEKIKDYLKCTDKEMILAKINGNYKVYRELCELSETLESKSFRNPEILPILTKVLNEQDGDEFGGHSFLKSKSKLSDFNCNITNSMNLNNSYTSANMPSIIKPIKSTNLPSYAETYTHGKSTNNNNSNKYLRIKSATSSSFFSSSVSPSSPSSSSSVYWNASTGRRPNNHATSNVLDQSQPLLTSNSEDLSHLNSLVKETIKKMIKKKKNSNHEQQQQQQQTGGGVNSLLEMSSGQQTVGSFFGSKSEHEVSGHETSSGVGSSFMTGSADSMNTSSNTTNNNNHSHLSSSQFSSPFSQTISQIFYTAALQQTKNYRSSVKYVEPVIVEKTKAVNNAQNKKSTRSTLAIIREESRLGKMNSKKLVPLKSTPPSKTLNVAMNKSTHMKPLIKQN
jgi:hypothetical protein